MNVNIRKKTDTMNATRNANFYMANLGSEFLRILAARDRSDKTTFRESIKRCLGIIDTLVSFKETRGQQREIIILKNIINDLLENNGQNYQITKKEAESYFYPFAIRQMQTARD